MGPQPLGFSDMNLALGNDAGILLVKHYASYESPLSHQMPTYSGLYTMGLFSSFFLLLCFSITLQNPKQIAKLGSAFILLVAIAVVPELSVKLAENSATQGEVEWNDDWPDEWKGTQVIVFEIDGQEHAIGGLMPQTTVYELTTLACEELGITTQIEQQYLGAYLVSFNGSIGDGWEFVDGTRSPVGMSDAIKRRFNCRMATCVSGNTQGSPSSRSIMLSAIGTHGPTLSPLAMGALNAILFLVAVWLLVKPHAKSESWLWPLFLFVGLASVARIAMGFIRMSCQSQSWQS